MRIGIIGIQNESNTFHPDFTELADFQSTVLLRGEEIFAYYNGAFSEITGFIEQLRNEGLQPVPLLMAFAMPRGPVSDEALDTLWQGVEEELERAGPLDGYLLAPHGAAVNQSRPDMDGWWLSKLRERVGREVPMVAVIDPHANLSDSMAEACDALISYRNNPHTDQKERGVEAAMLLARMLRDEVEPIQSVSLLPVCVNIECHLTSESPMLEVSAELDRMRALPGVLCASFVMGYPYADVQEMGSAIVVVVDGDAHLADLLVEQFAAWFILQSEAFRGRLVSPEAALSEAIDAQKPVALMDMGDNIGGGAPGDSTVLLHLCAEHSLSAFVCIYDPESAAIAKDAGVGARLLLRIGGKSSVSPAAPLCVEAEVLSLHEGSYRETQARHGGQTSFDTGNTVVVKAKGLTMMLVSTSVLPSSANLMLARGYRPCDFDLLILKGAHSPVAAYWEHCPTFIRVNTPGVTTADIESLQYRHRRHPLFPFEPISNL